MIFNQGASQMKHLKLKLIGTFVAVGMTFGAGAVLAAVPSADTGSSRARSDAVVVAQGSSCGAWKSTCEGRGGGASCDAKYRSCLKSGCFTEGVKFGGATHCSLAKQ
jgi:hypothetical protein